MLTFCLPQVNLRSPEERLYSGKMALNKDELAYFKKFTSPKTEEKEGQKIHCIWPNGIGRV